MQTRYLLSDDYIGVNSLKEIIVVLPCFNVFCENLLYEHNKSLITMFSYIALCNANTEQIYLILIIQTLFYNLVGFVSSIEI